MANTIKIKKGVDIKIEGKAAEKVTSIKPFKILSVNPDLFHGIIPKMVVKDGESIKAGSPLFFNKKNPSMNFVSPVSGKVREVVRGERRKVTEIVIEVDETLQYLPFDIVDYNNLTTETIKNLLLSSGLWVFIKQRPFDVIAEPTTVPKSIFISTFDTSPLAPDYEFVMKDKLNDFQTGINVLSKLTATKIHLGLRTEKSIFSKIKNADKTVFEGPHPAGNVGVHINQISPINKGETVWTVNVQDVAMIGRFFTKGVVDMTRTVALTGPEVESPQYFETIIGNSIVDIVKGKTKKTTYPLRFISGNVLTGEKIESDGYLTPYSSQISVIDEGSETHELLGWAMPRFDKFSVSNMFFSKFFPNKKFKFDARLLGGPRSIIMSGEWDSVFPMDILPEYLIKAMMAHNIDRMENLGAYEVAPEDFALCEFVDTSKLQLQTIVREALDYLQSEVG